MITPGLPIKGHNGESVGYSTNSCASVSDGTVYTYEGESLFDLAQLTREDQISLVQFIADELRMRADDMECLYLRMKYNE